jgi:hypothetical protein
MEMPRLGNRRRSNSIIVPKELGVVQKEGPQYPADDARAMSPRRNSEEIEMLEQCIRENLKEEVYVLSCVPNHTDLLPDKLEICNLRLPHWRKRLTK